MKIEIEGHFHDYCNGCRFIDIRRNPDSYYTDSITLRVIREQGSLYCGHHELCERLLEELDKRIDGSVVEE